MKGLTEEQLDHYKNKGYVSPVSALTSIEAKEIRDEIEKIEKNWPKALEGINRNYVHLISPVFNKVCLNKNILDAVESIIGKNILICGTTLFIKNPKENNHSVNKINDFDLHPARVKWFNKSKGFGFANIFKSNDDIGSSKTINSGLDKTALKINIFCLWPPLRLDAFLSRMSSFRPTFNKLSLILFIFSVVECSLSFQKESKSIFLIRFLGLREPNKS